MSSALIDTSFSPPVGRHDAAPIHVLWINAGLSCDGDSVALTAATQPSIEEIALGVALVVGARSVPDIRRHLSIRRM